jgi:hypothetical protein
MPEVKCTSRALYGRVKLAPGRIGKLKSINGNQPRGPRAGSTRTAALRLRPESPAGL